MSLEDVLWVPIDSAIVTFGIVVGLVSMIAVPMAVLGLLSSKTEGVILLAAAVYTALAILWIKTRKEGVSE